MELKKPAKDHRGEWDLVLDNEGTTVASLKFHAESTGLREHVKMLWPIPRQSKTAFEWKREWLLASEAVTFFENLGVDTTPLEKLIAEKGG